MTTLNTLENLLEENLKDIYSAEIQLTKALPKMAKGANSETLRSALQSHLKETQNQVTRLEEIGKTLGISLTGKRCLAMEGLIEEGSEALQLKGNEKLIDISIIAAAQRVEHYEISAYGTAIAIAEKLDLQDVVDLLQNTLDEEAVADEKLTEICEEELLEGFEASEKVRASAHIGS